MAAQEDYEMLNEILTRAKFSDEDRDNFIEEVMGKLGYKLKKLFTDDDSNAPSGPRRIGRSGGSGQRAVGASQYRD